MDQQQHVYSLPVAARGPLHPFINLLANLDLRLIAGRRSRSTREHHIKRRRTHFYSFISVTEGTFHTHWGNLESRILRSGEGVLFPPQLEHSAGMEDQGEVIWADFHLNFFHSVPPQHLLQFPRYVAPDQVSHLQSAILALHKLSTHGYDGSTLSAANALRHHSNFTAALLESATWRADSSDRAHALLRIAHLLQTIQGQLSESWPRERLAAALDLGLTATTRLFKQATGTTPATCVRRLRLEAARERIGTSHTPLDDIAHEVGFADAFHLSKAFKIHFGQAPKYLRPKHLKESQRRRLINS